MAHAENEAASTKVLTNFVKMDDGRDVEFTGKKKLIKESVIGEDSVQIRLDWVTGETRLFTLPQELFFKFAAHGAEQKLGDEISGLDNVEDCIIAVDELIDRLNAGKWSIKREGGGMAGAGVLMRALMEHTGKPQEHIKTFLSNKTHAEKLALRGHPNIKPIIEKIEAAKAGKKDKVVVDTDALLGELG